MGTTKMNLFDVISRMNEWTPTDFIFAERPWRIESKCRIVGFEEGEALLSNINFVDDYFGEVFAFKEYFGETYFIQLDNRKFRDVVSYAVNDA